MTTSSFHLRLVLATLSPTPSRSRANVASLPMTMLTLLAIAIISSLTFLNALAAPAPPARYSLLVPPQLPTQRLVRRGPTNPIGWRGEFLVLSLNENSAPSLAGPNDYYKSEGNPEWLVFHPSNRSWTGWVPLDGPSDTELTFQLVGQVQDRNIRQPMSVTIIKRPQGGRPRSPANGASNTNSNLSPDFLSAIPLPTSTITPKSPSALINQLAQVFSPTIKVAEVTLSDPALIPPESDTLGVTKLNATYGQMVFWSAPSRTVRWQQVHAGSNSGGGATGGALPSWLAYDAALGTLTGTVPQPHRTALPMPVARDLKRGALQLTVTANTPPPTATAGDNNPSPAKPTQVVVISPNQANRPPRIAHPNGGNSDTDDARGGWLAHVRAGTSIRWPVPAGWTADPDQDATLWVAVQSPLGLPKWATWDASQGVLNGRVPRTSTVMDPSLVTDWANVSLPLRGAMPALPWSLSTVLWVAAVDPLGAVSNWFRADVIVDEWVPPTPKVPIFDVPPPAPDGSGGGTVRLDELFATNVSSVFEWDGFVGILPSDAPVTLDQTGALMADPIGGNREIVAHVVVVDRKGGVGLVTVRFAKRDTGGDDVSVNGGGGDGNARGPTGSNDQQSVGEFLFDKWFEGVDTSSAAAFFRTAPKNMAVQILAGCVLGLMLALAALVVIVTRKRRRARAQAHQTKGVVGGASGKGAAAAMSNGSDKNTAGSGSSGGRRGSGTGLIMSLYNAGASANGSRGSLGQVAPAPPTSVPAKSSLTTPLRQQSHPQQQLQQQQENRKSLNRVSFSDTVEASDGTLQRLNQKEGPIGEGLVPRSVLEQQAPSKMGTSAAAEPSTPQAASVTPPRNVQAAAVASSIAPTPSPSATTPPCHPPTYPAPAPYLPPNPSATDLSLANAWLALCPDHYIAQSPTVSMCTNSMYSNRPESGAPGAPGNTMPRSVSGRSSGTLSSSFMEPPADMPHAVAIVGQPFTYDHPDLVALVHNPSLPMLHAAGRGGRNNGQMQAPIFRFGIRRDQNSPTWITLDSATGRLQGIPFAGDNGTCFIVTILKWNVAAGADGVADPDGSFASAGSRTVPPPHAQEAAKVWVSVSDAQMPTSKFAMGPSGSLHRAPSLPQHDMQHRGVPPARVAIPPVPALVGTAIPVVRIPSPPPLSTGLRGHPNELPKTPPPPQPQPSAPQPQRVVVTQVIPTTGAAFTAQPQRPQRTNSTRLTVRRLKRATTATVDTDYEFDLAGDANDGYYINSQRISEYYPVNVPGAQALSYPIRSSIPSRPPTARGRQRSSSVSIDRSSQGIDDPDTTRHLRDLLKHRRSGSFDSVTREQWRSSRYTRSSDMDREDRERFEAWLRGEKRRTTLMMDDFGDVMGGGIMR